MTSRVLELRDEPNADGECVLYVMSRDQRVRDNHALLEAQKEALEHKLPLAVVFNLYRSTGFRRREHYSFMIDGLKEVEHDLKKKDIPFIMTIGSMPDELAKLSKALTPRSVYFDFSPLRGPRNAQKQFAKSADCRVVVVDTHNIIPTWVVSDKEEFAAHTIRRKIHTLIEEWAVETETLRKHPHPFTKQPAGASWKEVDAVVKKVPESGIQHDFTAGEAAAKQKLQAFIETGLDAYADGRNDPSKDAQSDLSPYLHYGQLSALRILLDIMDNSSHPPQIFRSIKMPSFEGKATKSDGIDAFIEELVVRKELSDNFCLHNPEYDALSGVKDWAKKTLQKHGSDPREHVYTKKQFEKAETHDELWNAAQLQLVRTGKIHGYMRMYWAKKILEWTEKPETAVKWAIEFNDTYHLDGGDPNGYVGILWSIGGVHDRPWFDRDVYGTIRYMSANGISKKFDTEAYIKKYS
jgi:deoxyribodipyrimidine photo-lyase